MGKLKAKAKARPWLDPKRQCRELTQLNPQFLGMLYEALEAARAAGLDPLVVETYRTQKRQNYLYAKGRTSPGNKVTWTKNSKHIKRLAADVCPRAGGKIDWNRRDLFDRWGAIAQSVGLVWGGTFRNYDGVHVQAPWA